MLTVNSGIRQLILCENMVGAEGARAIGSALPSNQSLRILHLRKCGLGPEGAKFIAQGLISKSAALTELSVGLNEVGDDGAAGFAAMIRMNQSVREFYADWNGITSFGAGLIAEALRDSDCLQTLWLVGNDLDVNVGAQFAKALAENKVLRRLGFTSSDALPSEILGEMERATEKRKAAALQACSVGLCDDDEPQIRGATPRALPGTRRCLERGARDLEGAAWSRSWSPSDARAAKDGALAVPVKQFVARSRSPGTACASGEGDTLQVHVEPRSSETARVGQQIVMWDDTLQVREVLPTATNGTRQVLPVDLSED
ncbi:unnamed protein product [Prorocentrum cordatum]|uniref:Uncharacterized protein n=1 Tax=Prorocentrum cordatum TaxID=2364126 RepID=A0ABN9TI69_9DINO|nr:unnamed protein product [Polarella glacialis]